jgi:hypothetical protein
MFFDQLMYFVGWTALLGICIARLACPTVPAARGKIQSTYIWHEPMKFTLWFVLFLVTMLFWTLSSLQVAGVL